MGFLGEGVINKAMLVRLELCRILDWVGGGRVGTG